MQHLRTLPAPIKAADLAHETGMSVRSVYRDINSLRASGAIIDGEAGFGYTLVEDPALPPMMFSRDEMEALVLGLREVKSVGDPVLAEAAENALSKLKACLPERMKQQFQHATLHVKRFHEQPEIVIDVAVLRHAIWGELAVDIQYGDKAGMHTERRVLPLAIVFMDRAMVLLARCQMRDGFRVFRIDRIKNLSQTTESFRPHRVTLLRDIFEQIKRDTAKRQAEITP